MPDGVIPDKPAFKAADVCEIAQIQPYVLRSWESEFPDLGLSKTPGGPRVYRRVDVERVLRIRDLVFTEGLTLAGVRRRFEAEQPEPQDDLFTLVAEAEAARAAQARPQAPPPQPVARRTAAAPAVPAAEPSASVPSPVDVPVVPESATAAPSAGARRASTSAAEPQAASAPAAPSAAPIDPEAATTIARLKTDMRSLLDLLGASPSADVAPSTTPSSPVRRPKRG